MVQTGEKLTVIFNKILVNSVDSGAGIFIGNNTAYGWNSIRKENSGFGSARGGTTSHNVNLVYDNDHLDFPVEERDIYIHRQTAPIAQNISFQSIDVNAVTTNSTIAVGDNNQSGWNSTAKSNMGDGRHKGMNVMQRNMNVVMDEDIFDAPVRQNVGNIRATEAE